MDFGWNCLFEQVSAFLTRLKLKVRAKANQKFQKIFP